MSENLNDYKNAYKDQFKFHDENHWYLGLYTKLLTQKIIERKFKDVLSLGIGHNVVSNGIIGLMPDTVSHYHIVEGSEEIIQDFKSKISNPQVELFHSYFENFSPSTKYDAIEMGFVLEHVDDPGLILKRFKDFLKPNGIIFISLPNARSLHRLIGNKAGLLDDVYKLSPQDYELGHKRYFDLESAKALIIDSGLNVTNERGLMMKPITGDQIRTLGWGDNIIGALLEIGLEYPEISNCFYLEATI